MSEKLRQISTSPPSLSTKDFLFIVRLIGFLLLIRTIPAVRCYHQQQHLHPNDYQQQQNRLNLTRLYRFGYPFVKRDRFSYERFGVK
ncbi:hypothetical protein QR98_0024930, partial [Sarcoptes scabiei]